LSPYINAHQSTHPLKGFSLENLFIILNSQLNKIHTLYHQHIHLQGHHHTITIHHYIPKVHIIPTHSHNHQVIYAVT